LKILNQNLEILNQNLEILNQNLEILKNPASPKKFKRKPWTTQICVKFIIINKVSEKCRNI
jgi:hypothetical protein